MIYKTYGDWKTTSGFKSEEEAHRHVYLYHRQRDYIEYSEVRWIDLPRESGSG